MPESIFSTFDISGQGISIQRKRLSAVAKNIANANTTSGPDGKPYQREVVVVKSGKEKSFQSTLGEQITLSMTDHSQMPNGSNGYGNGKEPDLVAETIKDNSPARMVYEPSHPNADADGYVKMPNVNIVTEMVEMISAQRAFEANANVIESAKNFAKDSLEI